MKRWVRRSAGGGARGYKDYKEVGYFGYEVEIK